MDNCVCTVDPETSRMISTGFKYLLWAIGICGVLYWLKIIIERTVIKVNMNYNKVVALLYLALWISLNTFSQEVIFTKDFVVKNILLLAGFLVISSIAEQSKKIFKWLLYILFGWLAWRWIKKFDLPEKIKGYIEEIKKAIKK